jgi:hypothetical protein
MLNDFIFDLAKGGDMVDWTLIGLGCLGGALPDIIRIAKGRYTAELPAYLWSLNFWLGFVFLVGLGGFAAWIGGATATKDALAFGFGAPELLSRVLSGDGTRAGSVSDVRQFWGF